MEPEHKLSALTFGTLYRACKANGMIAQLQIFDGGSTVDITLNGVHHRFTAEYGDKYDAPTLAGKWLLQHEVLKFADFEG